MNPPERHGVNPTAPSAPSTNRSDARSLRRVVADNSLVGLSRYDLVFDLCYVGAGTIFLFTNWFFLGLQLVSPQQSRRRTAPGSQACAVEIVRPRVVRIEGQRSLEVLFTGRAARKVIHLGV
jgi:hypothetical protein